MYCIFVRKEKGINYALEIVSKNKLAETRNKDMLKKLINHRVAIAETGNGKKPIIIGYATITRKEFVIASEFPKHYNETLVKPESKYNCKGKGKWLYYFEKPEKCKPHAIPQNAIYHGRSYCEI